MAQWDSKKFEEKATDIAHAFGAGRSDLHDLTTKVAKSQGLNEEQIRRLGRAVNVKAFEQKFASLKGREDRIVDFEPVDAEAVIKSLFHESPVGEKRASAAYPDLSDQMRTDRGWGAPAEKVAEVNVADEVRRALPKDPPIESQINHWRKVAEDLRVKVAGAELRWDGAMEVLQGHAKRLYWNRDEFEKDAMALHGGDVLFELNALRSDAGIEPLYVAYETATKLAEHLFADESEDTLLIKKASSARADYVRALAAAKVAEDRAADLVRRLVG